MASKHCTSKAAGVICAVAAAFLLCPAFAAAPRKGTKPHLVVHPSSAGALTVQAWGQDNRTRWPAFDRASTQREDNLVRGVPGLPMRVGVNRPVPGGRISLKTGRRTHHPSGRFLWTYCIEVPDAQALRAHVSRCHLPADSELCVAGRNGDAEVYRGQMEPFWTASITGDSVYLEYRSPVGDPRPPDIEVDEISHIYVDPLGVNEINALASLACQIDVNCYGVPPAVRDAVARLEFTTQSGTFRCTGTLLSDADTNTSAGYILTANHCISTPAATASMKAYWFYQTDVCSGTVPTLESVPQSPQGGTLLVTSTNTDFTLIRLRDDPQDGQGFVEWSTNAPSGQVVSVHHPLGEHKRVSIGAATSSQPICGSYPTNRFQYVRWLSGITEGASSGGPLFDSDWRLVGQLWGLCSFRTPTCTNSQDYNALFGRFSGTYPMIAAYLQSVAPDDAYEHNDTLEQAQPIAMGTNSLRLVDFDDYFSIVLPRAARVNMTASFSTANLDLDLALLDANGNVLLSSASATGTETINSGVLPSGAYFIHATKSHRWGGNYTLTLALVPDSNAAPVAVTDQLEWTLTNGVKVRAARLLINDLDMDGDPIRLLSIDPTSAYGATVTRQGEWVHYTPAAGFTNQDSFTYQIADFFNAIATGSVIVTNSITPVPSPNLFIVDSGDGSRVLQLDGIPGKIYAIEYSETLAPPDWQWLGWAVADAFGQLEFTDTPPNGSPQRFYRSVYP